MKQRTLFFVLLLLSTLTASAYDAQIGGIYYNLYTNAKTATVTFVSVINSDNKNAYTGSVIIPETVTYNGVTYSVTSIGDRAFSGCSSLISVTIPNSVTYIGNYAFEGCSDLTSVALPNSVTIIGSGVFGSCSGLTSVIIPNSVTSLGSGAFRKCTGLTSVSIPNSVKSISSETFSGCSSLTSITIPNSVKSIDMEAFKGCSSVKSIEIPNSVTSIGSDAFTGCSSLTSVKIGNSVTSIGNYAFLDCSGLTSIEIPNSVTSLGIGAFYGCKGLTSVTCEATSVPSTGYYVFYNVSQSSATLYVPASALENYRVTEPWSYFGTIVAMDEPVVDKCATPLISFVDGQLTFDCETEDVEYVYEVKCDDAAKGSGKTISLTKIYTVTVYAIKDGYYNSDVATEEIYIGGSGGTSGIRGDANIDGEIGMADIMFIVQHILTGKFPDEDESASLSCPDGNHPHMIDLGMPSGTKWACCNVGASKPEGHGNYYAWGEIEPKSKYDVDTYIGFNNDELVSGITDTYGTEKDVAHVKWGDRWRIPTCSEIYELRDNSTYTEITYNGVKGIKFTGKNGNSIFLPAAGRYEGDQLVDNGVTGHYWQGSTSDEGTHTGEVPYYDRNMMVWGLTIRPVYANSTTR